MPILLAIIAVMPDIITSTSIALSPISARVIALSQMMVEASATEVTRLR
jgi:hypothetical protein